MAILSPIAPDRPVQAVVIIYRFNISKRPRNWIGPVTPGRPDWGYV